MEEMYQNYKDIAEFFIVYISEAHAADDRRPVGYAKELGINEHTDYGERCDVAARLVKDKKLTIPCLIDGMNNNVDKHYHGWPDRVFLVRKDGRLAVAAKRGPMGFRPGILAAKDWLAEYKAGGVEPELVGVGKQTPDFSEFERELRQAYQDGEYDKALAAANRLHELDPHGIGNIYNIACMHCLLGDYEMALTWLGKAVDAGYDDADHMLADEDLASIRDHERFRALVNRARSQAPTGNEADFVAIVGDWEMKTMMGDDAIEAIMSLTAENGRLSGVWKSRGREMEMKNLRLNGSKLAFTRSMGSGRDLHYEGTLDGDKITGKYKGPFGELTSNGTRTAVKPSDGSPGS